MSKVSCVLPTRGLIYAETIRGILNNGQRPIIISGLPIPECFNTAVTTALHDEPDYVWFVEEDNEIPGGVLQAMLEKDKDIITMDYPVAKGVSHIHKKDNEVLWCGIGCTLINSRVFRDIDYPWFEADILYNQNGDEIKLSKEKIEKSWGGHDVRFFKKVREKGYKIDVLEGWRGQHFRALEIPKRENNKGYYTIISL